MSVEEWKARMAAEVCRCGHTRGQHWSLTQDCGIDLGPNMPCLCERFEHRS